MWRNVTHRPRKRLWGSWGHVKGYTCICMELSLKFYQITSPCNSFARRSHKSARVNRWMLRLQLSDTYLGKRRVETPTVRHIPGKENITDSLSRFTRSKASPDLSCEADELACQIRCRKFNSTSPIYPRDRACLRCRQGTVKRKKMCANGNVAQT